MIPKKILYCTDFSENSKPAQQLALEYARAFGASLVVLHVFTHGWTGFNHLLLGSIAEKVLKMAPMPVLTVRSISTQNLAPL